MLERSRRWIQQEKSLSESAYVKKIKEALTGGGMQVETEKAILGVVADLVVTAGDNVAVIEAKPGDRKEFLSYASIPEASYYAKRFASYSKLMGREGVRPVPVIITSRKVSPEVEHILSRRGIVVIKTNVNDKKRFVEDFKKALPNFFDDR